MAKPRTTEDPTKQEFKHCTLLYDLTEHSITVNDDYGDRLLKVWRMRDNPGGFDLATEGTSIEINNPTGIVFVPLEGEPA